jgi:aminocarboxymuconate-semialdehyde decarboxylase
MPRPLRIDLHTHVLPETWPDLKEKFGYGGFVRLEHHAHGRARMMMDDRCFREVESNTWSAARRIEECDRHGVDVQVLSTVPVMFAYWAEPRHTLELARLLNDHIAGMVRDHPRRFVGLGTLPLQDPELALGELERSVGELGLAGVQIGSHVNAWNLDQPELFPVFERAAQLGTAVFVHPWDMLAADRMERYWMRWLVGMPTETTLAVCSMIFGGVLERLPALRVAFAHGGGSFPGTLGRIEKGFLVRPDLCATHNDVNPRDYLGRFYVDSLVHDAAALRYLIDLVGARRIALGTDYPFPLGEAVPGALIDALELPAADRRRMLAGTALEFLDLDARRFVTDDPAVGAG